MISNLDPFNRVRLNTLFRPFYLLLTVVFGVSWSETIGPLSQVENRRPQMSQALRACKASHSAILYYAQMHLPERVSIEPEQEHTTAQWRRKYQGGHNTVASKLNFEHVEYNLTPIRIRQVDFVVPSYAKKISLTCSALNQSVSLHESRA